MRKIFFRSRSEINLKCVVWNGSAELKTGTNGVNLNGKNDLSGLERLLNLYLSDMIFHINDLCSLDHLRRIKIAKATITVIL